MAYLPIPTERYQPTESVSSRRTRVFLDCLVDQKRIFFGAPPFLKGFATYIDEARRSSLHRFFHPDGVCIGGRFNRAGFPLPERTM